MCTFNQSALSVYSTGLWAWLAGPVLYFAVFVFGLVQLLLHVCRADKIISHYVSMLSMFLVSLLLRGIWFMLTCPTPVTKPNTNSSMSISDNEFENAAAAGYQVCLLYTSDAADE